MAVDRSEKKSLIEDYKCLRYFSRLLSIRRATGTLNETRLLPSFQYIGCLSLEEKNENREGERERLEKESRQVKSADTEVQLKRRFFFLRRFSNINMTYYNLHLF